MCLKPIKNYKGLYLITIKGEIWSHFKSCGERYKIGNWMKQHLTDNGYFQITLTKNKKSRIFYIHRLIAEAFIPNPYNLPQVIHINGIKTDNRVENLKWVTYKLRLRPKIFKKRIYTWAPWPSSWS